MNTRHIGLTVLTAVTLAACGSGDPITPTATGGALSAYAGTWKTDCYVPRIVKNTAGNYMYQQGTYTFTPNGDNLSISYTQKIYQPTDTTCTGTVAATHTQSGSYLFQNNATAKLDGADVTAQRVTLYINKIGGLSSGNDITIGDLVYPGDYFTITHSFEDYLYLKGNQIYGSTTSGSPILTTTPGLTKI